MYVTAPQQGQDLNYDAQITYDQKVLQTQQQQQQAPTPEMYIQAFAQQAVPINNTLECEAYAGINGITSLVDLPNNPNTGLGAVLRQTSKTAKNAAMLAVSQRVGTVGGQAARALRPATANEAGTLAEKL